MDHASDGYDDDGPEEILSIAEGITKEEVLKSLFEFYEGALETCRTAEKALKGGKKGIKEFRETYRDIAGIELRDSELREAAEDHIDGTREMVKMSLAGFERKGVWVYTPRTLEQIEAKVPTIRLTEEEVSKFITSDVQKYFGVSLSKIPSYGFYS